MRKNMRQCSQCERNRQLKFFKANGRVCLPCQKQTAKRAALGRYLQENYGITLDEYDRMLEEQEGACAICRRVPAYRMDCDHDHAVEKALIAAGVPSTLARYESVRGLLCKPCNRRLLPAARDNIETLARAADYLEYPPAHNVLGPQLTGHP